MTKVKKTLPYLMNTILVLSIILLSFKLKNMYPFGELDFAITDAEQQYKPMLYQFIMSIKTHTLSNYTFLNGLGNPTLFNFLYYLASPLNLFALIFNTPNSMYLGVTLLKVALASITTTYYFKKKSKKESIILICTLSYVFCGWFLAYFFNTIWLDTFLLFPLFQLGLENLLKKKKNLLYIITLSLLYITNFYMAFLLSVYTLFYFLFYLFKEKRTWKENLYDFELVFLSTLIAFLCIAFYLYGIYESFLKMGIQLSSTETNHYTVTLYNLLKSCFYGNTDLILSFSGETFPNIGMNSLLTLSTIYYFFNKKISKKEKIVALISIFIILLAFLLPPFDKIINGFHTTIGFTFRYTFVISFMMTILFYKNYKTWEEKIDKKVFIILGVLLLLLLIEYKNMSFSILITNLSFLLLYTLYFLLYKNNKGFHYFLILLVSLETLLTFTFTLKPIKTNNDYNKSNFSLENTTRRQITTKEEIENSLNNNLFTNTKSANLFTSMGYNQIVNLTSALGCPTNGYNRVLCSYYAADPVKMILNIESDYTLEKIFATNKDILLLNYEQNNPALMQSNIIEAMTNVKGLYKKVEMTPTKEDDLYYYYELEEAKVYTVEVEYNDQKETYTMEFQTLHVEKEVATDNKIILYELQEDKLKEAYNILKEGQIKYTHYEDNHLKGEINVKKEQVIFTSIPYDTSWEVKVDGKKVEPVCILDGLLGIELEEGIHTIELKYKTNYLPSIIISCSTIVILVLYNLSKKKKND